MQNKSIIKQYNKKMPCYYCGAPPPSSREHAPVKSMFKPFNCDRITVPSCDKHNSDKNLNDRAIVTFFLKGLFVVLKSGTLTENQLIAIDAYELDKAQEVKFETWINDPTGELNLPLSHIDETKKVENWIRHLTAALIWSILGYHDPNISWDDTPVWSPEHVSDVGTQTVEEAANRLIRKRNFKREINAKSLYWWHGWSSHPKPYPPDIYNFEISQLVGHNFFQENSDIDFVIRHWFYTHFSWYIGFTVPRELGQNILNIVKLVNEKG